MGVINRGRRRLGIELEKDFLFAIFIAASSQGQWIQVHAELVLLGRRMKPANGMRLVMSYLEEGLSCLGGSWRLTAAT